METNVNYTMVGAFVIALIAAIVIAIIWLSSGVISESYTTYMVYMQESVSGLSVDSSVEYNGVEVGSVKSIELNHKNPHLVEVLLNIKKNTPITKGTVATLDTRGVTGVTYMALKDVGTDLRPLVVEDEEPYPIIKTAPSLYMRLDTALTNLSKNFSKITDSLQTLLGPENQKSIKETLAHLDQVTNTLAINNDKLNSILVNTERASQRFDPLLKSGETTMRMLEIETLPAAYKLLNNLDNMSRSLSEFSFKLNQNPSILIRGAATPAPGPGEK